MNILSTILDFKDAHVHLQELLNGGLDPNTKINGTPLLIHACQAANTEVIRLLLSAGANVNEQDHQGCTALMFATFLPPARNQEFYHLLEKGANIHIKNNYGSTVLDWAINNFNVSIAKDLIGLGAALKPDILHHLHQKHQTDILALWGWKKRESLIKHRCQLLNMD